MSQSEPRRCHTASSNWLKIMRNQDPLCSSGESPANLTSSLAQWVGLRAIGQQLVVFRWRPPCSGDLQRITGGLLTEMALVMPRTGRRAYILLCMVPGRGDPSVRCSRRDHRLVLTETRQALFMELRIGNRTTLFW